jgi:hypothetical protein
MSSPVCPCASTNGDLPRQLLRRLDGLRRFVTEGGGEEPDERRARVGLAGVRRLRDDPVAVGQAVFAPPVAGERRELGHLEVVVERSRTLTGRCRGTRSHERLGVLAERGQHDRREERPVRHRVLARAARLHVLVGHVTGREHEVVRVEVGFVGQVAGTGRGHVHLVATRHQDAPDLLVLEEIALGRDQRPHHHHRPERAGDVPGNQEHHQPAHEHRQRRDEPEQEPSSRVDDLELGLPHGSPWSQTITAPPSTTSVSPVT